MKEIKLSLFVDGMTTQKIPKNWASRLRHLAKISTARTEGPMGNSYDLPVTLKGEKKEKQDRPEMTLKRACRNFKHPQFKGHNQLECCGHSEPKCCLLYTQLKHSSGNLYGIPPCLMWDLCPLSY
jgi:hypothetical protein